MYERIKGHLSILVLLLLTSVLVYITWLLLPCHNS